MSGVTEMSWIFRLHNRISLPHTLGPGLIDLANEFILSLILPYPIPLH